jgi:hypothetical protein
LEPGEDYLPLLRRPRFGYGRAANPCVDCRIYMVRLAFGHAQQVGAQFVVTGEVVGQRTMSQKRRDLETVAHHSGKPDLLLRPLSAKILTPTLPEREGWVDREQLHGFFGRGRRKLIALARLLGLEDIPVPCSGCALTEPHYSRKVFDLLRHQQAHDWWDFELLKFGRHFRFDEHVRIVVGRHEHDNGQLQDLHHRSRDGRSTLLTPVDFRGPRALIVGPCSSAPLDFACGLVHRFSKHLSEAGSHVRVDTVDGTYERQVCPHPAAETARTLAQ